MCHNDGVLFLDQIVLFCTALPGLEIHLPCVSGGAASVAFSPVGYPILKSDVLAHQYHDGPAPLPHVSIHTSNRGFPASQSKNFEFGVIPSSCFRVVSGVLSSATNRENATGVHVRGQGVGCRGFVDAMEKAMAWV